MTILRMVRRAALVFLAVAPLMAGAEWLSEVEITHDPVKKGEQEFTVRIMPNKTHQCDKIVFECIYHQEFPWENARGKAYTKIHEPVPFTYRARSVRLVADLDSYTNFRVPISLELLSKAYGEKVFNKDYPVTIDRLRITGSSASGILWKHELKAPGLHKVGEKPVTQQ
jgi:hypothetical protein